MVDKSWTFDERFSAKATLQLIPSRGYKVTVIKIRGGSNYVLTSTMEGTSFGTPEVR